jgi:hypothetical protein
VHLSIRYVSPGTIGNVSGEYSSAAGGRAVIRVIDVQDRWGETTVDVVESAATGPWLTPSTHSLAVDEVATFHVGGGDGT